ncbi:MAG: LysR family transcriptional regulator [Deltaproteobacteria bacterium]|nr:LysR family transcriptional regulator [Deltaproteobacteria bacterium]
MDFNKIAVFVRVIDSGSLTRAAAFLRQPKSRVSRNIAALEKELGTALLYRTTRQFSPTEAGRDLYQRCRQQIYELEGAAQALKDASHEVSGLLRITAAEDMGSLLLGPLIAELKKLHPKVSTQVLLSNDVVDLVKEGIDLAIRVGELEDTGLKARAIGHVEFIFAASPGYLKQAGRLESLADLARHSALVFSPESEESYWLVSANGRKSERVYFQSQCRANSTKILIDLALAGQGVALIPGFMCVDALKDGRLKRVLPSYCTKPTAIHFVWPGQKELSPKVRAFVDLGLKRLGKYFAPTK